MFRWGTASEEIAKTRKDESAKSERILRETDSSERNGTASGSAIRRSLVPFALSSFRVFAFSPGLFRIAGGLKEILGRCGRRGQETEMPGSPQARRCLIVASIAASVNPETRNRFSRDFSPATSSTCERLTPSHSARKSRHAALAAPSTGGALSFT